MHGGLEQFIDQWISYIEEIDGYGNKLMRGYMIGQIIWETDKPPVGFCSSTGLACYRSGYAP